MFLCLIFQGSANAVAAVFTYARSQAAVERLGFRQDLDTYLLLSGNFNTENCFHDVLHLLEMVHIL